MDVVVARMFEQGENWTTVFRGGLSDDRDLAFVPNVRHWDGREIPNFCIL